MEGYYKQNGDEWLYGKNIILPNGVTLTEDNKDDAQDGWVWLESQPRSAFELWEERVDVVKNLKDQAVASPLALRPYITSWFVGSETLLASFISIGSNGLLDEVTNSPLSWWDLRQTPEDPSPREVAILLLTPLTIWGNS